MKHEQPNLAATFCPRIENHEIRFYIVGDCSTVSNAYIPLEGLSGDAARLAQQIKDYHYQNDTFLNEDF